MIDLLTQQNSLWREHLSRREISFLHNVREFALREVAPYVKVWEEAEALPRRIFRRAGGIGLMGMTAPKKFGGQGFSYITYFLAIRELAKHHAALAIDIAVHNAMVVYHLVEFGSPAQKRKVFPRLVNGEWIAAWALTERETGSDIAGVQTTAALRKDGRWEIDGVKQLISQGRSSNIAVIIAASGATEQGKKELSAFLVEKSQMTFVRRMRTCGTRASEVTEFKLVRARGELLGPRGHGRTATLAHLDKSRIGVAAVSLGLARAALDGALHHALTRKQFGMRIADFQAIQFMLADCDTDLRAGECLALNAAILATRKLPHSRESSMAKLYASEAGSRICSRALQIYGGIGYTSDLPIERYWRDARLFEIALGSSELQRIVISREILKMAEETPPKTATR